MTTAVQRTGRQLVKPILFDKLATRITKDHPELDRATAERVLDQAIAFLATGATATQPLGPSELVDIGWHTFILHTRDYEQFCHRIAGRFIHHEPTEPGGTGVPLSNAVNAMRASGFSIDTELWSKSSAPCTEKCCIKGGDSGGGDFTLLADCTQCHAGCTDSPSH